LVAGRDEPNVVDEGIAQECSRVPQGIGAVRMGGKEKAADVTDGNVATCVHFDLPADGVGKPLVQTNYHPQPPGRCIGLATRRVEVNRLGRDTRQV
jgi:hypothetical protein